MIMMTNTDSSNGGDNGDDHGNHLPSPPIDGADWAIVGVLPPEGHPSTSMIVIMYMSWQW